MSESSLPAARRVLPPWLAALVAVLVGAGLPLQSRVNGELADQLDDPMVASLISLAGGLAVLILMSLCLPGMGKAVRNIPVAVRKGHLRPGYLLAGAGGALFVLSQSVTVVVLGVALFTVAIVAGQTIGGLITDATGFAGYLRRRPTARRLLGGAFVVLAVVLSASGSWGTERGMVELLVTAMAVLVVGAINAFQQAANARVGGTVGSPLAATVMNFIMGTSIVGLITLIPLLVELPAIALPSEWWLYLGGLFGIAFIAGTAALIPHAGVLAVGLGSVVGQLLGSLVLDLVAPVAGTQISSTILAGIALALIAVVVTTLPRGRQTFPR